MRRCSIRLRDISGRSARRWPCSEKSTTTPVSPAKWPATPVMATRPVPARGPGARSRSPCRVKRVREPAATAPDPVETVVTAVDRGVVDLRRTGRSPPTVRTEDRQGRARTVRRPSRAPRAACTERSARDGVGLGVATSPRGRGGVVVELHEWASPPERGRLTDVAGAAVQFEQRGRRGRWGAQPRAGSARSSTVAVRVRFPRNPTPNGPKSHHSHCGLHCWSACTRAARRGRSVRHGAEEPSVHHYADRAPREHPRSPLRVVGDQRRLAPR